VAVADGPLAPSLGPPFHKWKATQVISAQGQCLGAGAGIGPDEWITLRPEINGAGLVAFVNERKVLTLTEVDAGTEAYFASLRVSPR